jgi:hypothetical protein
VRVRVVLGVAFALAAAAVIATLSQHDARLAGTDFVAPVGFHVEVPPGAQACQASIVPDDTASVGLLVATNGRPRPPLTLSVEDAAGAMLAGGRVGGGHEGPVTIRLAHPIHGERLTRQCVRNAGVKGVSKILLAGDIATPANATRVDGGVTAGIVAMRFLRPGRESWWHLLPVVATRFGLGKAAMFGGWTLAAVAAVVLLLWVAVARLLLRELR